MQSCSNGRFDDLLLVSQPRAQAPFSPPPGGARAINMHNVDNNFRQRNKATLHKTNVVEPLWWWWCGVCGVCCCVVCMVLSFSALCLWCVLCGVFRISPVIRRAVRKWERVAAPAGEVPLGCARSWRLYIGPSTDRGARMGTSKPRRGKHQWAPEAHWTEHVLLLLRLGGESAASAKHLLVQRTHCPLRLPHLHKFVGRSEDREVSSLTLKRSPLPTVPDVGCLGQLPTIGPPSECVLCVCVLACVRWRRGEGRGRGSVMHFEAVSTLARRCRINFFTFEFLRGCFSVFSKKIYFFLL